jgi:hypothetical protein
MVLIKMGNNLISITWYFEPPIDFEHKQYLLLSYLQIVDKSFIEKQLSPHYLYLEKILEELYSFNNSFDDIRKKFDKNRYVYFNDNSKLEGEDNSTIYEIKEIVDFSIPQVNGRLDLGKTILKKNKQILF